MDEDKQNEILLGSADAMNVERTDKLFDITIDRAKAMDKTMPLGEPEIKQMRVVLQAGSLHVRTAQAAQTAVRLAGFRDNMQRMKSAIENRAKNALRPDGKADEKPHEAK